jgi:hypothetical protein
MKFISKRSFFNTQNKILCLYVVRPFVALLIKNNQKNTLNILYNEKNNFPTCLCRFRLQIE